MKFQIFDKQNNRYLTDLEAENRFFVNVHFQVCELCYTDYTGLMVIPDDAYKAILIEDD